MIIHPEALADRGCWISGDRVYAFVSSEHDAITAVGYHGAQPVSRNSRVFRGGIGAFRFFAWGRDGTLQGIHLTDFDWLPGILTVTGVWPSGRTRFSISATGRNVVIAEEPGSGPDRIAVLFSLDSLTTDVHGNRSWSPGVVEGGRLRLEFRDRVLLDAWMRREGPYAGDFLIPEPIRRTIFRRRCRSGFATREDLLPEFQNSPFPLYDARVTVTLGGPAYEPEWGEDGWLFLPSGELGDSGVTEFHIAFDEGRSASPAPAESVRKRYLDLLDRSPCLGIPGFPEVEGFAKTVPGLVESCVVREIGVPRATPGEYYWVWAWDAMVTALASLRWGDLDGAGRIAAFVDGHRDEDGCIPMRWTRSLEPLDTQPRGSLESLLCSLVDAVAREGRDQSLHRALFPRMVEHLDHLRARSDDRGLFANAGFYPDLPLRFGRTERSAVALEVGAFYTFCRTCANVATALGDQSVARRAEESASRIEASFLESFWDAEKGFVIDSRDLATGEPNRSYPLFSLLFLHTPLGWPLIRGRIRECAEFISRELLTGAGMRLLPARDRNARAETVAGAWYPHWDIYALKILRRAGRSREIMIWLNAMETVLSHLGYAPEFIMLDGLDRGDGSAWLRHGAASNLNCATGWYQALIEGVFGLESDPGGLTVIPLALPLERLSASGLRTGGSRWELSVRNGGPVVRSLRVDGEPLAGSLKIPVRFCDGGDHLVEVEYGQGPLRPGHPDRLFRELVNAELLEATAGDRSAEVRIRSLGRTELVFTSGDSDALFVDGAPMEFRSEGRPGLRVVLLPDPGEHVVRIAPRR